MPDDTPPKVVLVTGPPGAGKSTALLALDRQDPDLTRFGVRDYGLQLAATGHPLGLEMRETLLRQELLSNELVLLEFMHFLDNLPTGVQVVVVEGYPRDLQQCEDLLRAVAGRGIHVTGFVVVNVPDDVARERVANRQLCTTCGGTTDDPTAASCPDCGGGLIRRRDDDTSKFELRLADYHVVSGKLRAYFAERELLREVDGTRPSHEVRESLSQVLSAEHDTELADVNR
ncbi:adenylate kinase [Kitasatospora atroaurantiaca]|uniref:Adenylate kinase n=1 Tax=Kitasatospora atroaurantiaca TaxID=285545 RepID=A0A561EKS2_9ACTN|nr:nucleoside monophosphate kinase [Kitasatospora atroaurantiaca]TWE16217.1 adenylate kinase family enzyme [Kitasatospora atroaurantiaca]